MRALLPVAVLCLLAGCVGAPLGGGSGSVPTPTGPCTVDDRPTTDASAEVEPVDYPEAPSSPSASSVESYVASFEDSYRHNDALADHGNVTYLETYVEDVSVTRHGSVYVVRLESYTNGGTMREEGEGTPIQIHWDGAPEPVTYLLTEDRLVRGDGDLSPERLPSQSTVACF
jgi:hypothetical protein